MVCPESSTKMAKADKKQLKQVAKPKPASTKEILAKAKKAIDGAVCFPIIFIFPLY